MTAVANESAAIPQVGNPVLGQIRDFIESDEPTPVDPIGIITRAVRGRVCQIGFIALAIAFLLALLSWVAIDPGYQSTGIVRILPREAKLLYIDADDSRLRLYDAFTNAEVHLMQARPVLESAWRSLRDDYQVSTTPNFVLPKDVGELSQLLSISNRKGLVTVAAKSSSPELAAAAVNAVLSAYESQKDQARDRVNEVRRSELQEREKKLALFLQELDAQYLQIGGEHDVTSLSKAHIAKTGQLEILEERIGELDNTIAQFQRTGAVGADDIRNTEIQRALLLDQALAEMTYERASRLAELATLRSRYQPTHTRIVTAELELKTLEGAIAERRDQITTLGNVGALTGGTSQSSEQSLDELESVRTKLLDRRILLTSEANELISKLVKIRRVVAEQQRVGTLLDDTKQALDEVIVESQAGLSRAIDVIARGKIPDRPIDDKRKQIAFGAALFGALATLIGFVLSSLLNPRIRYTDDLKPDLAENIAITVPGNTHGDAGRTRAGFKLRNEIDIRRASSGKSIVVAVSGVTTAADSSGLANALSGIFTAGKMSVLLIDASSGSRLTANLALDRCAGLANVMSSKVSISESVESIETDLGRFDVLGAGSDESGDSREPITTYTLQNFRDLIDAARLAYDVVVLDVGRIAAGRHSALAVSLSDQLIHIISAGDRKREVGAAEDLLNRMIPERYLIVFDQASELDPLVDKQDRKIRTFEWHTRLFQYIKKRLETT